MSDGVLRDLRARFPACDAPLCAPEDLARYEQGARHGSGRALCVVRPRTTEQVQGVMQVCARHRCQVVVQGANTGMTAASSPDVSGSQVLLSLERFKAPLEIDATARVARVGAGVLLSELNAAAAPHGLSFPIDLSADPTLGGMVATNTGGTRLIRYGDVRQNLLGLKAVLADEQATLLDATNFVLKNNTGFDAKQLFVGTAGSFGVVTEVMVRLLPLPMQRATALIPLQEAGQAQLLLRSIQARLHDFCVAFEGMSGAAMRMALAHVGSLRAPFAQVPDYAVLVELASTLGEGSGVRLEELLVDVLLDVPIEGLDAVVGRSDDLWALRHALSDGSRHAGSIIALDVSVPLPVMFVFRAEAIAWLGRHYPNIVVADFGHIADCGMHFNLVWPHACGPLAPADATRIREHLYDRVVRHWGGSYSAEHGIGPYNQAYYDRYTAPALKDVAAALKTALDPFGLMGAARLGPAPGG